MNQMLRKAAVAGGLALGLGAAATAMNAVHDPIQAVDAQAAQAAITGSSGPGELALAFREASRAALPAVVYVQVEAAPRTTSRQANPFQGTPFEDFFMQPGPQQQMPRRGSGSGFIISSDGYILTNNHVVQNATQVTVTLTDRREFDATVVGRDPNTDVAVLKIEGQNLPVARIGDPDALQVGDWVLALGYPLDLGETVTAGIVSAKGRSIGIMRQNREAAAPLEHFIQTDAAINPGNSGGPLVNLNGEVIGMNTAIASPTGYNAGYGFAVPVSIARRVADDLIRHGVVHRPRLGVEIKPVSLADVEVFGLPSRRGAVVATLQDGPARSAGIAVGDVIVAIGGREIDGTDDLMGQVALRRPGETVPVEVVRYGERLRFNVRLGTLETESVAQAPTPRAEPEAVGRLGFAASEVTPQIARQLNIRATEGVVVTQVEPMGPAAQAGLTPGFQIERINGRGIRNVGDLRSASENLRAGATVSIVGRTAGGSETIVNYRIRN
jgi:serine protease Do